MRFIVLQIVFLISIITVAQNKTLEISGKLIDDTEMGIPYVAISIPSKSVGTSTNEEGFFNFSIPVEYRTENLEISSIGFKTFLIKVEDFLNKENNIIILESDIATLDEITLTEPVFYVKTALKNLKNTTISKPHQLNLLYRRFSTEDKKARFLVEHYMKVIDRGPSAVEPDKIQVVEGRKSADYRFIKQKLLGHGINQTAKFNVLRNGINSKDYNWSKIGDTKYDGEDVIIIEGKQGKWGYLRLYIGMDTYGVYKIENSMLNSVYIYKKNNEGKLYLSYHSREWKSKKDLTNEQKMLLGNKKSKIDLSYRHEMIVLGLESDKKNFNVKSYGRFGVDMGDLKTKYNPFFWNNFSAPPPTKFHLKSIKEIESLYGVPMKTQFKVVN